MNSEDVMNKNATELAERVKILEKALSNLADTVKRREMERDEEIKDILHELKAIKLFLTRAISTFKEEFPEIRRKVK